MKKDTLSKTMTIEAFDNGYWYATEIKAFAKDIGIKAVSGLRKDELEDLIRHFLRTGEVKQASRQRRRSSIVRDVDRGLHLDLPVVRYTNDKATKTFIDREARRLKPSITFKSGARYRLNRWREAQLEAGMPITYRDVIEAYIALCAVEGPFPQAPSGRYINFLSDFLAGEKDASRADGIRAWKTLKELDIPKNYAAWKAYWTNKQ